MTTKKKTTKKSIKTTNKTKSIKVDIIEPEIKVAEENKKWGGYREGAGRPIGTVSLEKKELQEGKKYIAKRVLDALEPIMNAQLSLAKGINVLMCQKFDENNKKKGKAFIVDDPDLILAYINDDLPDEYKKDRFFYISAKVPNNKAIANLLDRAFGRPVQSVDIGTDGERIEGIKINFLSNSEIKKKHNLKD